MADLLWLTVETPDVGGGGGQRRQFHQIRALVDRGVDVAVAAAAGVQSDRSVSSLVPVRRFAWRGRWRHRRLDRVLRDAAARRVILPHVESAREFGPALERAGIPFLVDFHNVMSRWEAAWGTEDETAAWRAVELGALRGAERATACSAEEREALVALGAQTPIDLAPHGVDPAEWPDEALGDRDGSAVALFGSWEHGPNREAAEWLAADVWPAVRASVPAARLLLIGPGTPPSAALRAEGAEALGRVPVLAEVLGAVRVAVVPIRSGIGTRVKFVESLACGAAVVATTAGGEGFSADGAFARADEADAFARACIDLLQDESAARELGRRGRELALTRYTWEQTTEPLVAFAQGR